MYLCRKLTDNSFPTIGEHFGRDHSTVIHAYNLIARRVSNVLAQNSAKLSSRDFRGPL